MRGYKRKLRFEAPIVVPLGEIAAATGECDLGSGDSGGSDCIHGFEPANSYCQGGFVADSGGCFSGVKAGGGDCGSGTLVGTDL